MLHKTGAYSVTEQWVRFLDFQFNKGIRLSEDELCHALEVHFDQ